MDSGTRILHKDRNTFHHSYKDYQRIHLSSVSVLQILLYFPLVVSRNISTIFIDAFYINYTHSLLKFLYILDDVASVSSYSPLMQSVSNQSNHYYSCIKFQKLVYLLEDCLLDLQKKFLIVAQCSLQILSSQLFFSLNRPDPPQFVSNVVNSILPRPDIRFSISRSNASRFAPKNEPKFIFQSVNRPSNFQIFKENIIFLFTAVAT